MTANTKKFTLEEVKIKLSEDQQIVPKKNTELLLPEPKIIHSRVEKCSVFTIFDEDLQSLPDNSFRQLKSEMNIEGDEVRCFIKHYDKPLFNVFDKLEIKLIGKSGKNYLFKNSSYDANMLSSLNKVVNQLVDIYGTDDTNNGTFSADERQDISEGFWTGRWWTNDGDENSEDGREHCKIDCSISEGISLVIWSTQ